MAREYDPGRAPGRRVVDHRVLDRFLAGVVYTGRPLATAHGPHAILGGHFERRLTILREVLDEAGVAPEVRDRWLATERSLRDRIVGSEC